MLKEIAVVGAGYWGKILKDRMGSKKRKAGFFQKLCLVNYELMNKLGGTVIFEVELKK